MFCIYCRSNNPPDARFCAVCGKWQQIESGIQGVGCTYCGGGNPPDASFCRHCSQQLTREMNTPIPDHTLLSSPFSDPSVKGASTGQDQQVFLGYMPTVPGSLPMGNAPMVPGSLPMGNAPMVPGSAPMGSAPMVPGGASVGNAPYTDPIPHMGHAAGAANYGGYPPQPYPGTLPGNPPQTFPSQGPVTGGAEYPYYHSSHHTNPYHNANRIGHAIETGKAIGIKSAGGLATKWVVITIIALVVVVGSGAATTIYFLTRPQPLINVSSTYTDGKTPVGSTGTTLHFQGQHFSNNSSITFLLDNSSAPGAPSAMSDQSGNVSADLPITADWSVGQHMLTARDASNYVSKAGVLIEVVSQGHAGTPGPFGAPADNASFKLDFNGQGEYDQGGGPFSDTETLMVTGHPDPTGGSVCGIGDNGQPQQTSSKTLNTGETFTQTRAYTCTSGAYKSGKVTYTETVISDVVVFNNNGAQTTCTMRGPHIGTEMSGSFTAQGKFSGSLTYPGVPASDFACDTANFTFWRYAGSGSWTGNYTLS